MSDEDDDLLENFCGCCGTQSASDWCRRCREHIAPPNRPEYERNYYAQHGEECPYQVEVPICSHLNVKDGAGGFGECQDCGESVV